MEISLIVPISIVLPADCYYRLVFGMLPSQLPSPFYCPSTLFLQNVQLVRGVVPFLVAAAITMPSW